MEKNKFWLKNLIKPMELAIHPKLNKTDGDVFSMVDILDHPEKGCWASNTYIGALLLMSADPISKSIGRLKEWGFVIDNGMVNERRVLRIDHSYKERYRSMLEMYCDTVLGASLDLIKQPNWNQLCIQRILDTLSKDKGKGERSSARRGTSSRKESPQKKGRPDSMVEFWNSLPGTRKHKDPSTKVYRAASRCMTKLRRGVMFKGTQLDKEWFQKQSLKQDACFHMMTDPEIKKTLENLSLLYSPGYWPENKGWLKSLSLADLIYNPRAMNSWFMAFQTTPPKTLGRKIADYRKSDDLYPNVTKGFEKFLGDISPSGQTRLVSGVFSIVDFHKKLPERAFEYGQLMDLCPSPDKFCLSYLKYLKAQDMPAKFLKPGLINTDSPVFAEFLDDQWDEGSNALGKPLRRYLK